MHLDISPAPTFPQLSSTQLVTQLEWPASRRLKIAASFTAVMPSFGADGNWDRRLVPIAGDEFATGDACGGLRRPGEPVWYCGWLQAPYLTLSNRSKLLLWQPQNEHGDG